MSKRSLSSEFSDMELSTQILIHEAMLRGICVEILDRKENIIRLQNESKVRVIKQATISEFDSYISFEIMKNKHLTKKLLNEKGITTPFGKEYFHKKDAIEDYKLFKNNKCVIKPNSTNFGKGLHFVKPNSEPLFTQGINEAFCHDNSVLVESFIPYKEYRFVVIGDEVIGSILRDPANVVGDGRHSIQELVKIKNEDPDSYKYGKNKLHLTAIEKNYLSTQNLNTSYIPEKDQKIYLRENSNVSTGGDPIDVTDNMHASYFDIAKSCVESLGISICGVDILIQNIAQKRTNNNYAVIELNFNPMISMHEFPLKGTAKNVGYHLLNFYGF